MPKQKIKISEKLSKIEKKLDKFDDIHIICYAIAKETGVKKTPDIIEIGLGGSILEKFEFIKNYINKAIRIKDFFTQQPSQQPSQLVDVRGVTKGHGFTGPIKRFGISLREHKSEKGKRRPGSVGPWTPSRITFRAPIAGQYGFFTRVHYNSKVIGFGSSMDIEKFSFEFPHYGKIKTDYVLVKGSVQGPSKRQVLLTLPLRETKQTTKQNFEILNLLK